MSASAAFRVFVTDERGIRTEMPELYVRSSADDLREAMAVAVERLRRQAAREADSFDAN